MLNVALSRLQKASGLIFLPRGKKIEGCQGNCMRASFPRTRYIPRFTAIRIGRWAAWGTRESLSSSVGLATTPHRI